MSGLEALRPGDITLAPYARTRPGALIQGRRLAAYVAEQGPWLDEVRPGVRERYGRDWAHAAHNVQRIGMESSQDFQAYVVRDGRPLRVGRALGIATIVPNQTMAHPALPDHRIVLTDIDYSLAEGLASNEDVHRHVASALLHLAQAKVTAPTAEDLDVSPDAIFLAQPAATIIDGQPNPSYGFIQIMERFGEPAPLAVAEDDPYSITKGRQPLQLYLSEGDHYMLSSLQ